MCTVILKTDKPKIAKRSIKVYKFGEMDENNERDFIGAMRKHKYIPDVLNETKMEYVDDALVSDTYELDYSQNISMNDKCYVSKGFHSFATIKRLMQSDFMLYNREQYKIAKFIIPKGALYHKNGALNVVSNQIIFKKFIYW